MHSFINEMKAGDVLEGYYLLKDGDIKTTVSGKTFFAGTIADSTGTMDAKMWNYTGRIDKSSSGKIIYIEANIQEYQGSLQCTLTSMRLASGTDPYSREDLVPCAPIDTKEAFENIRKYVFSIEDPDYANICKLLINKHAEAFRTYPAAKSVHHSFVSGLLMHTYNMLRSADFLSGIYAECIDRNLLMAGTLLHDIGKITEFEVSELGLVTEYSVPGKLLGHLYIGANEVSEAAKQLGVPEEKSILLQHLILSHHGKPEYGACELPQTAEAELLSLIDMTDSRMEIYTEVLHNTEDNTFSDPVYALDKRTVYRHN